MNQRDWELLDKQLGGFNSRPPKNSGDVGLVAIAVFLAGVTAGSVLFAHDSSKHPQVASRDVMVAYSLLDGGQPTTR
jgi:hypothetical protein